MLRKIYASLIVFATGMLPIMATATEQPVYETIASTEVYELRRYEPFMVAETEVMGNFSNAGNKAFRILASYIFGNNKSQEKMAMTAPVISGATDGSNDDVTGEKMAMTAPVISRSTSADNTEQRFVYQFVMESKYSRDTLPEPMDSRVTIKEQPARLIAAHRFSGRTSEKDFEARKTTLLESLEQNGLRVISTPELARYDAPYKPWFMRRNEILVEVERAETPNAT